MCVCVLFSKTKIHFLWHEQGAMNIEGSVAAATIGVLIHVFLALLFLFSTVANILVLIIFYRRPALRTLSNR